ncbi:MAG: M43 family zinc metalloprotease [Bacteroidales bacterium]|nr:M43 family zinc metalloprotease [Bacteroidales bacterium]
MRKTLACIVIILLMIQTLLQGQFVCNTITSSLKSSSYIDVTNYIPNNNTPTKYIRVNIHYMLRSPSDPLYPGNFTQTSDGLGNSYNGYQFAEDLINMANYRLSLNYPMRLPPGNSTPVLTRKYYYLLNGVFFHEDNEYYFYPSDPSFKYKENIGEAVNIYITIHPNAPGGGYAVTSGIRYAVICGVWEKYHYYNKDTILWVTAHTLNHEIGHNLSLLHTVLTNDGKCYDFAEDYCSDTPTRKEIRDNFNIEACCGWNCSTGSNNMMDYSGEEAITPQQLGRVHWTLDNEMNNYLMCSFLNPNINITNFITNKSYIGEIVTMSNIVINNNKAIFINAKELIINGPIEIWPGSLMTINISSCN